MLHYYNPNTTLTLTKVIPLHTDYIIILSYNTREFPNKRVLLQELGCKGMEEITNGVTK